MHQKQKVVETFLSQMGALLLFRNGVAIINATIIAVTFTIIDIIPVNIVIKLLIAFALILIMIFSMYISYGKYLQKKWGKKNGNE